MVSLLVPKTFIEGRVIVPFAFQALVDESTTHVSTGVQGSALELEVSLLLGVVPVELCEVLLLGAVLVELCEVLLLGVVLLLEGGGGAA